MRHLTGYSLLLILLISCVGNCFAQGAKALANEPPLSSPDEYIERGTALWQNKADYDGAILNFTKAIEIDEAGLRTAGLGGIQAERLARTYYKRAILVGEVRRRYDDAIADLNRAITLHPQLEEAYCERGLMYISTGDFYRAIADYTDAIEINPKSITAHLGRGRARKEIRDYIGEMEDYNTCIEIDPNDPGAYFQRGIVRTSQRDYRGALADYNKLIELDPHSFSAHELRGELLLFLNRDAEAEQDFKECFMLKPSERPRIEKRVNEFKRLRSLSR